MRGEAGLSGAGLAADQNRRTEAAAGLGQGLLLGAAALLLILPLRLPWQASPSHPTGLKAATAATFTTLAGAGAEPAPRARLAV